MRGGALQALGGSELLEVIDLSELVAEQRALVISHRLNELMTPTERLAREALFIS